MALLSLSRRIFTTIRGLHSLRRARVGLGLFGLILYSPIAFAQILEVNGLPNGVKNALEATKLPENSLSFSVTRLTNANGRGFINANWQPKLPMNPASTMKLVTTLAATELLGPQYQWKTNIYTDGTIDKSVLKGNLYWLGSGDPKLVPEELSKIMLELKKLGIREIDGNLIFDRTAYSPNIKLTAPEEVGPLRTYSVSPDPLLFSFESLTVTIKNTTGRPEINYTPKLANLRIENKLSSSLGDCTEWKQLTTVDFKQDWNVPWNVKFSGKLPKSCDEVTLNLVAENPDDFLNKAITKAWEDAGGQWGSPPLAQAGRVPRTATLLLSHQGITLGDAIKDVNKFSNNVMARQIFLTLSLEKFGKPASTGSSNLLVKDWFKKIQISAPELVLENGSGLSSIERISSENMTQLLMYSVKSQYADIFINSLPIAGSDGTMRNRLVEQLKRAFIQEANAAESGGLFKADKNLPLPLQKMGALIKTGTLSNVRAVSGFVVSRSGQVFAVSAFINDPNAGQYGAIVHDALLTWLLEDGIETSSLAKN